MLTFETKLKKPMKKILTLAFISIFAFFIPLTIWAANDSAKNTAQKALRMIRVTPEGEDVPAGRQIVIEFNRPVVPMGRMERKQDELPITITPGLNCHWRWLNTSTLACHLDEPDALQLSTRYTVTIHPGINAEDGATMTDPYHQSFITERPKIREARVISWLTPDRPVIEIYTSQPVKRESLQKNLSFQVTKKTIYAVNVEKIMLNTNANGLTNTSAIKDDWEKDATIGTHWQVTAQTDLPPDTRVTLHVTPGLISILGAEKSIQHEDVLSTDTYPAFEFLGISCISNANKEVLITPDKPQTTAERCNPLSGIALRFTAPVTRAAFYENFRVTPELVWGDKENWINTNHYYSELNGSHQKDQTFSVWFPPAKANQTYVVETKHKNQRSLYTPSNIRGIPHLWSWIAYLRKALDYQNKPQEVAPNWILSFFKAQPQTTLKDEFGRVLQRSIHLAFSTDHRPPHALMPYAQAILEKAIDSDIPLYVNNLRSFTFDYHSLTANEEQQHQTFTQSIHNVQDIQFAIPMGIRQMLHGHSGLLYGQLSTNPKTTRDDTPRPTLFAEVTPYEAHVKLGHFNTLAWVTDLATGQPVNAAKVVIYKDVPKDFSAPHDILATAITDESGIALLPGLETLDPDLSILNSWGDNTQHLFMRIDKSKDIAVLPISNDFEVGTWQLTDSNSSLSAQSQQKYGHMIAWGTTAQGIYRVGDTIQYKLYVRNQDNKTLLPAPDQGYTLKIIDPTAKTVAEIKDLHLSAFGAYSGEFTLPKEAAVGWYAFNLSPNFTPITLSPMRVLVSDFTPSPFKVRNQLNGDFFTLSQTVQVDTIAQLHAGGAYTDAAGRVTAILNKASFHSSNDIAKDFQFETHYDETGLQDSAQIYQTTIHLDNKGESHTQFSIPKQKITYGKLSVESAVQDERGKYIATKSQADYVGLTRFVGLKTTQWVYNAQKPAAIQYLVVDTHGMPVNDTTVTINIEQEETTVARVKDAGNAYTSNYNTQWKLLSTCKGKPQSKPLTCEFTPDKAGTYRATARIKDTQDNDDYTQTLLWAAGKNYVLWHDQNDTYLPIVPEKKEYHVGDTARYLIKNPYPDAIAFITIERYGVIDHFVQKLAGSTPILTFPIKPDYLPGFYLSVMVFSPRVAQPLEKGQVDLGKPTCRMGYVKVPVKDHYKEIIITAKTDKPVYKPQDMVTLQLHAAPKTPSPKSEPIEFTIAVLDESVFDLISAGQSYFDPYAGFYQLADLDVRNYSLLTRLVGRQKFEKKGANPGGDGGMDLGARNLFKFVSYWNPSVQADAQGNATVRFEAPDNLTGWRILALAATPTDRLGLGVANFNVNRPTEIRPVMPNQVMEKDNFNAGFSVMNRTDKTRTLTVNLRALGNIDTNKTVATEQQSVTLAPYQRTMVWMPITVATLAQDLHNPLGEIKFIAHAGDDLDTDAMTYSLSVNKMRSLETAANYGTTTQNHVTESILLPTSIYSDIGNIAVSVSPSLISNVEGAFKYLRDYPYDCWEQKLTKGVMASHYQNLKPYFQSDFTWDNSAALPQQTLNLAANYQAPNGGMVLYIAQDQYVDPYLSAYTALAFNWLKKAGYQVPIPVETKLQDYLLNFLRHDTAPDYYNDGMTATVRAVALAALAGQDKITMGDLQRYLPAVKQMSLFGQAYFIQAALQIKGAEAMATQTAKSILAHADQSGGKIMFSESLDDRYKRILSSSLRDNCAILDTFTQLKTASPTIGRSWVKDIAFKLVSAITQTRKNRDHWENTQENLFCMNALVDYSRAYENVTPHMQVTASMDRQVFGQTHFEHLNDIAVTFSRPLQQQDQGRKTVVEIARQGKGRLYYTTRLNFAPLDTDMNDVNAGIEIHREYSVQRSGKWLLLNNPLQIKQGELVRVDIYLSLPGARNFVVVDDPVPGGLEPVNRDLATASTLDADQDKFIAASGSRWFKFHDWSAYNASRWSFYHQELRHDAVRYYADYLEAGNYHLSYTAQAIASGQFTVLPVKAEEMYNPDVFGKSAAAHLVVER